MLDRATAAYLLRVVAQFRLATCRPTVSSGPGGFIGFIESVPLEHLEEHQGLYEDALRRFEQQHGPNDGGPEAGVREPRCPKSPPSTLAVECEP